MEHTDGIMPALKISYGHLPWNIQQCFSYCSLYPNDYLFSETDLVNTWISQGFVYKGHASKTLEEIGAEYLTDLVNFGFFSSSIRVI